MRAQPIIGLGIFLLGILLNSISEGNSVTVSTQKRFYLTSLCQQKLLKLKAPIALPTYLPAGYKLNRCQVDPASSAGKEYQLIYKNNKNAIMTLYSGTADGLGSLPGEQGIEGKLPAGIGFSKDRSIFISHYPPEAYNGNPKDIANLIQSEWVTDQYQKQAYRMEGDRGVTLKELMKVMESLRFLR